MKTKRRDELASLHTELVYLATITWPQNGFRGPWSDSAARRRWKCWLPMKARKQVEEVLLQAYFGN
jgi:hypothetical protein